MIQATIIHTPLDITPVNHGLFDFSLAIIFVLGMVILTAIATRRVILAWVATFALIGVVVFEAIAKHHGPRVGNEQAGVAQQHLLPGGPR